MEARSPRSSRRFLDLGAAYRHRPTSQGLQWGNNLTMSAAILVVSDREPLAWLLREQRFAVPSHRVGSVPPKGSVLFIYTTRGCYRNPRSGRGRIIAKGTVTEDSHILDAPVEFGGRRFAGGFGVLIRDVAPAGSGVDLAYLAGELDALPERTSWSVRMRRSIVPLTTRDEAKIKRQLEPIVVPLADELPRYLDLCRV